VAVVVENNPRVSRIVLIGAMGAGKTDIAGHASISIAWSFARTYWPVFRQNLSTAKLSAIPSCLNMLDLMNFVKAWIMSGTKNDFELSFRWM
jgi:hypothetical protein